MADEQGEILIQANGLQRLVQRVASSRWGAWLAARTLHHVDRLLFRLTNGRVMAAQFLGGLPVFFVTTTGARSGRLRTTPLIVVPDGRRLILIASNWGGKRHPAWCYNLRAHPQATIAVKGVQRRYTAREAHGEERARCWETAVSLYAGYAVYARRTPRQIPVFLLEPGVGGRGSGIGDW